MDISLQIDQKSGIPIYVQIMDQIKHQIASGALQPGQQLPTIREMAVELTVNLHTVAHAYAELERDGFLTIQRGRGTFICEGGQEEQLADLWEQKLNSLVQNMLADALNLGYEPTEVLQALEALIAERERTLKRTAKNIETEAKGQLAHGRRAVAKAFC